MQPCDHHLLVISKHWWKRTHAPSWITFNIADQGRWIPRESRLKLLFGKNSCKLRQTGCIFVMNTESITGLTKYLNLQLEEELDRKPFKVCASVGKLITSWQPATSGNFYGLKTMQIAESGSFYSLGTLIIAEYGTTTELSTNIAISLGLKLLSFYCELQNLTEWKNIVSCHSFFGLEGIANCRK